MAHSDFASLKQLLKALDDQRNDIYLHIDKKAGDIDFDDFKKCLNQSQLYIVPRRKIYWGHTSIIECEIDMLNMATKQCTYQYYHLLSGVDYPLKSQDYIHDYFKDKDKEYLSYYHDGDDGREYYSKIRYYYPLIRWIGRAEIEGPGLAKRILRSLTYRDRRFLAWQKAKEIDRTKKYANREFVKGDQWFSITDRFAKFVISNKKEIMKTFRFTNGPDEFFLQTLAYNSDYKDKIENNSLRLIDWKRGGPYEFQYKDINELLTSDKLFVRKVSYTKEPRLIEELKDFINKR